MVAKHRPLLHVGTPSNSYLVIVALLVNSLDDTTEVPSIHLPHEGGHVAVLEVFA